MGPKFLTTVEILLLAVLLVDLSQAEWSYKGNTGPSHWHDMFPEACSGKMQSPININPEETVYNPHLKEFAIWYDPPRENAKMYVKNNGHAVQVDTVGDFFVTNGGLDNVYKTAQFHFHWGHKNSHGSEHHIQGQPHPLELHIVNYNHDMFGTLSEAATQPLGLAVLGVLFEIVDKDNKVMDPIIKAMEKVRDPDEDNAVEIKAVSLRDLLPSDMSRYFRYNGSLTTPGCFESVVWTVFETRQKISLDQLLEFRKVLKPKFYKHKHNNKKKHHRRHVKRSSAEKTAERNAKEVLDELGIRNNHMMEDELKADLMKKKAEEVTPAHPEEMSAEAEEETTPAAEVGELDEVAAKRAEENIARHVEEKHAEEKKAHEEHLKLMEKNEEESEALPSYIQEILVNNFRPIQPINNRLIQRSFKLGEPRVIVKEVPQSPRYEVQPDRANQPARTAQSTGHTGSSSRPAGLPVVILLITAFLSLFVKS